MDKSLEICNLPRLNQEQMQKKFRPFASTELESIIKKFPTNVLDQIASQGKPTKHY